MKNLKGTVSTFILLIFCLGASVTMADEATWIDVRSQAEWNADHIEGPALIPHSNIADEIGKLNLDKDAPIKLYCRSGNRAGIAKQALEDLGYRNVQNTGSIDDARRLRAESE